jgi:dTDP-L-rhamnose 4-epimerase
VAALLGKELGVEIAPVLPETYRAGDIRHCVADTSQAKELLDFTAQVRLEDGVAELAAWVKSQTALDRVDTATAELAARGLAR